MTEKHVVINPRIANGAPAIADTQIPVHEILARLAGGESPREIVDKHPALSMDDIRLALNYAAGAVRKQARAASGTQPLEDRFMLDEEAPELDVRKILIVDDLEDNRILMKHMFKGSDFKLVMAANAHEALEKARTELPIVIISDIQMPSMSGLDLLTVLRSDERTKNMGVILVTAYARGAQHASHGLALGADEYINRPFIRNEFLSRVGTVMRIKRTEELTRRQARAVARHNKGLELVNELALAVTSSLDLQEIFASSMQKLSQLLDAEAVSLVLINEDRQELVIDISSYRGKRMTITRDLGAEAKVTAAEVEEQLPEIVQEIITKSSQELGIASLPGTDVIDCIPMVSKDHTIGAIAIINQKRISFADSDRVLLNSAVGIITVAVENASLLQTAQDQVDDLIVLNEIGRALTSTLNQDQIWKQTTLLVQRSLQAEAASLWMLDDADKALVLVASSGIGSEIAKGYRLPTSRGLAGYVARTGEPFISPDVTKDERFFAEVTNMVNYQPRSILSVPVRVRGHIIGVMQALHRKIGWFDEKHMRLFHSVASSVGIAAENAQLFSEIQEFNRHLEQMVAERTQELTEEKEKTDAILASMADGLLVIDPGNRILMANSVAEEMLDFKLEALIGCPIGAEQLKNPLWQRISTIVSSTEMTDTDVDVPDHQTGAVRSIQARSAKVRNVDAETIGTVIVLRDITALKEVERMKARFMAGVTHELKTPLSVIRLHSNNLLTYHDRLPAERRTGLLNAIQIQVGQLEQLIEDILQLSRLDSGLVELKRTSLDLDELISKIIDDLEPLAEAKQIVVQYKKPRQPVTAYADSGQLERVVRNLIDNAIKYTPVGGSVQVQTISEAVDSRECVGVRVSDSGVGIPAEHRERVFDRFHRVDLSHTIPGTGLGLAIVKEIVNSHGGNIRLESEVGQGSSFMVTLPSANNTAVE